MELDLGLTIISHRDEDDGGALRGDGGHGRGLRVGAGVDEEAWTTRNINSDLYCSQFSSF